METVHSSKGSHIASSLSCIDLLAVIFSERINTFDLQKSDRIILSKGHAAAGLYSVMTVANLLTWENLRTYCKNGSVLGGHVSHTVSPYVPLSTGSLGHGFPYTIGLCISDKKLKRMRRNIVIISDGECDEGTTWESALIGSQLSLDNLTVVIDRNQYQSMAKTEEILQLEPLADKWASFNWDVISIDGHSHEEISKALSHKGEKPLCIIANTTKGKGVSFMENSVLWHYKSPSDIELDEALRQINGDKN